MDELHKIRSLHLFAGIGGGILADTLLGHQCVCAVEIDNHCQRVLWQRQYDGCLPWFPIFDDIKRFDGRPWRGLVDIVCAGFPCQPFSVAGQRKGADDSRNLWPDTIRVIREVGPRWALLENVPGLLSLPYWGTILGDLAEAGNDAERCVLGADSFGANNHRKRLWILAANHDLPRCKELQGQRATTKASRTTQFVPNNWWKTEPAIRRVDDGNTPGVVRRNQALGNVQVPIVAARALRILMDRYQEDQ